jgi:nicotinate-nucleotide adenylyltransferase
MRLGVLGGTFDPVHQGHLDVALAARAALQLDRVLFVPSRVPPHRHLPYASASHRFAMVALALQAHPAFAVSDIEVEAIEDGPGYTDATLDQLQRRGIRMQDVYFVTGADAFADIRSWRNFPAVLDRCHFVVVSRPGYRADALRGALPELAERMVPAAAEVGDRSAIILVETSTAAVSASEVRRKARAGESLEALVPTAVAEYIQKHDLYSSEEPKGMA